MNKTHEELAREATDTLQRRARQDDDLLQDREVHAIILAAITAAVQAERERARSAMADIRGLIQIGEECSAVCALNAELARLSLNGTEVEGSKGI